MPTVQRDTKLRPGSLYRITAICPSDSSPTMMVGDVVTCASERARCVRPEPDDGWWFVDYLGPEAGYGTLAIGLEEVETNGG
jgi:hypothetical protein